MIDQDLKIDLSDSGRQEISPAPGVLDFDKKLIQFREKSTLGVQPIAVVHYKDVK